MSATYHTPIGVNASLDSVALNAIFGALDQAIVDIDTRVDTLENVRIGADGVTILNLDDGSTKILASNTFTRSTSYHKVDTEGATASDYLDTISGGNAGDVLVLEPANSARSITLRAGQDNLQTNKGSNYTLPYNRPKLGFFNGSYWTFITEEIGNLAVVQHQEAQNTSGGTATLGGWETRDINTKASDAYHLVSILKLPFTSGGTYEIAIGDTIEGTTSGETAVVFDVELTSGTWAGADAAGNLWIHTQSGAFSAENLDVGAETNVATIAADSTTGEIRLKAGSYRVEGWAQAYNVDEHQTRLQDTTNTVTLIIGSCAYAAVANTVGNNSYLSGRFTLTDAATIELQHRVTTTRATTGYGRACNFTTEVYASLSITQEI